MRTTRYFVWFVTMAIATCFEIVHPSVDSCRPDCSTTAISIEGNISSNVVCSVDSLLCSNGSSAPFVRPVGKQSGWYFYDRDTQAIALNFSWSPLHISTVEQLVGYKIQILQEEGPSGSAVRKKLYYCLHTDMDYQKHATLEFYYDCYGKNSEQTINPGDVYHVIINSIPKEDEPDSRLFMNITVPSCSDPKMSNHDQCRQADLKKGHSTIDAVYCSNRSVKYNYSVPAMKGSSCILLFCKLDVAEDSCEDEIETRSHLPFGAVLYNITLPKQYGLNDNYSLTVWDASTPGERPNFSIFSYATCQQQQKKLMSANNTTLTIALTIAGSMMTIIIVSGSVVLYRRRRRRRKSRADSASHVSTPDIRAQSVLVVHANQGEDSESLAVAFAIVLEENLDVHVELDLFSMSQVAESRTAWMEKVVVQADRIILLWTEAARRRWAKYCEDESSEMNDMFVPTVARILAKSQVDKCIVVHFDSEEPSVSFSRLNNPVRFFKVPDHLPRLCTALGKSRTLEQLELCEHWSDLQNSVRNIQDGNTNSTCGAAR